MKNAALKHDTQGFLLGEPTELSADGAKELGAILAEVQTIRQHLAGASSARSPSSNAPGRVAENDAILTPTKRSAATREVAQPMARGDAVATTARSAADQQAVAAVMRRAIAPAVPKTRDDRGRFVPNGTGNGDKGDSLASDDRGTRGLIGKLSRAVLNSGAGMEDADPAVKAFNEVAQPMARGYELLTGGSEDKKQTGMLRRIFGALNVFRSDESSFNKAANKSLKTLEGKESEGSGGSGGGFFGALMGMIPGMGLFSAALAKGGSLLSSFGSMLMKIPGVGAGKGLLSKIPGLGGLAGGAGIGGGAAAGGVKALGKGMLKRIPILGALLGGALAWGESSAAENDETLSPEKKRAKKGSAWGSAAGGVAGAAVGSLLGPVGMIVGGVVGDWLGGQFGEMIGGNWTAMTEGISSTWTACTSLFSSTWNSAVSGASAAFDSVKTTWGDAVGKVSSLFSSAYDYLKGIPVIGPAIEAAGNAAKKAAEVAASAAASVKGKAVDVAVAAKDKAVATGTAVKDAAISGADYVANNTMVGRGAVSAYQGAKKFGSGLLNRAFNTGADYKAGNIGGLDEAHTRGLVASTAMTESGGGKLDAMNKQGYMGRYQAGAGWLADAGLMRGGSASVQEAMKRDGFKSEWKWSESGGMSKFLDDPANWKEGMSKEKYLASADVQDAAFKTNSDQAYAGLVKTGTIKPGDSQEKIAGLLKARHLAGLGGAKAVAAGGDGAKDANGTSARKYYEDVAQDRHGLTAAYSQPTMPTAMANASAPPAPSMPAMPSVAEAPPVIDPMASTGGKPVVAVASTQDVGQDIRDRRIAHVVTGGLS